MHQRNCRVIKDLNDETFEIVEENLTGSYNNDSSSDDLVNTLKNPLLDIKPGIKLLKSDDQWKAANFFSWFRYRFVHSTRQKSITLLP